MAKEQLARSQVASLPINQRDLGASQAVRAVGADVTLISGGPRVEAQDNFSGTFGDAGAGLNIYSHDGRSSGFVRASYKFKDDNDEGAVSVG